MDKKIKTLLLAFIVFTALAFKVDDQIELIAYLNARSSAKFKASSRNVVTQLKKGTKGKVLETKKMNSGNYGLKIEISDGPRRGESYWVYYNKRAPKMKLFDDKNKEIKTEVVAETRPVVQEEKPEVIVEEKPEVIPEAKGALLTETQEGIRDPDESVVVEAAKMTESVLLDKKSVEIALPNDNVNCPPEAQEPSPTLSAETYTESEVVEPFTEVASSPLHSVGCMGQDGGWLKCSSKLDQKIEGFKLVNSGPNQIVKTQEYYINREFSFEFEDQARSDMKLIVADAIDDTTSHTTYSVMLFFPRSVLPAVKRVGEELLVTLPNKETVRLNALTKEVIGGVFTEGPMEADPARKNKAKPANIKYTGSGVMIRADKSGDLPFGDIELPNGKNAPSISVATISKQGFKDCKVPSKDIWYTDHNKGGNTFIRREFATDKGLDEFIQRKCGFSLY